ncbi:MAG: rhodanese-like domain-containing protein [Bacteroidota bacterium]
MNTLYLVLGAGLLLLFYLRFIKGGANIPSLSGEEFLDDLKENDGVLVDVRSPAEYAAGHIEGAQNLDFFSRQFKVRAEKLPKEKAIYVYCKSGTRSNMAAKALQKLGFERVINLAGGTMGWRGELVK